MAGIFVCKSDRSRHPKSIRTRLEIMNWVLAAAFLALSGNAFATPVKYNFSGKIDDIRDISGNTNIFSKVAYGQDFSGSLYYDSAAPFGYMIQPNRSLFYGPSDPFSASVSGKLIEGTSAQVQLFDGYSGYDQLFISTTDYSVPAPFDQNTTFAVLRFQLHDRTETAINGGQLPSKITLSSYQWLHFGFTGYTCPSCFTFHVAGNIDTLEVAAVPEPSIWSLLIVGFGITGFQLRQTRRQRGSNTGKFQRTRH